MISQVTDKKAHNPVMCPVVWGGFLPWGIELCLNGFEGFGKQRCEEGLPEKRDEGSKVGESRGCVWEKLKKANWTTMEPWGESLDKVGKMG